MKKVKLNIIYLIISAVISFIIAEFGAIMISSFKENLLPGILTILLAFLILYFSFYTIQIKNNQEEIKEIDENLENLKNKIELNEKLLNTLKDIIILNKVKKIR